MMRDSSWVPSGVDVTKANAARVYDYLLGGRHNFPADRWAGEQAVDEMPDVRSLVAARRQFQQRAVRFLLSAGIRQFIDLGSGIPTVGNVHEIAHAHDPSIRVVYVDNDPVAVAH
ncbi:MAG TPA: SAM-dependent methyltransferase, partial [Micromonosporaceae bacterium]|nr:SAM-dependent methyltransferase [Micromonosporaceae bacterium]